MLSFMYPLSLLPMSSICASYSLTFFCKSLILVTSCCLNFNCIFLSLFSASSLLAPSFLMTSSLLASSYSLYWSVSLYIYTLAFFLAHFCLSERHSCWLSCWY